MIKFIKRIVDKYDNYYSCHFSYRDMSIQLNCIDNNNKPYIGCALNKNQATQLRNWLTDCLESSKNRCDYCWDYKKLDYIKIECAVICDKCGALLEAP